MALGLAEPPCTALGPAEVGARDGRLHPELKAQHTRPGRQHSPGAPLGQQQQASKTLSLQEIPRPSRLAPHSRFPSALPIPERSADGTGTNDPLFNCHPLAAGLSSMYLMTGSQSPGTFSPSFLGLSQETLAPCWQSCCSTRGELRCRGEGPSRTPCSRPSTGPARRAAEVPAEAEAEPGARSDPAAAAAASWPGREMPRSRRLPPVGPFLQEDATRVPG